MKNQNTGGGADKLKYEQMKKKVEDAPKKELTDSL